ncbi:MAG: enolase C-terminal domain-like protein [Candidatus Eisenbacteria bacterium]|nr:enolase C-terminal domain-like protein [Candidatus Eisenbacteria bacterium]
MLDAARRWLAAGFHILKIKVASDTDPDIIHEIRMAGGEEVRIWVDANQGLDPESLVRLAPILQRDSVELIEQPFPIGRYEEYARVRPLLGIPIFLDEEVRSSEDVALAACAGGIDGVNVKMAKMGGIREALRAIHVARAHGLQVLLGCFFESSLGISASAHLQALADRIDLDSPLHLEADPYTGLVLAGATVAPTQTPGLGVMRAG